MIVTSFILNTMHFYGDPYQKPDIVYNTVYIYAKQHVVGLNSALPFSESESL
jgi:hypothetical protein